MIKAPSAEGEDRQDNDEDSSRQNLRRIGSQPEEDVNLFILQTSMRKLVFNDKECRILI